MIGVNELKALRPSSSSQEQKERKERKRRRRADDTDYNPSARRPRNSSEQKLDTQRQRNRRTGEGQELLQELKLGAKVLRERLKTQHNAENAILKANVKRAQFEIEEKLARQRLTSSRFDISGVDFSLNGLRALARQTNPINDDDVMMVPVDQKTAVPAQQHTEQKTAVPAQQQIERKTAVPARQSSSIGISPDDFQPTADDLKVYPSQDLKLDDEVYHTAIQMRCAKIINIDLPAICPICREDFAIDNFFVGCNNIQCKAKFHINCSAQHLQSQVGQYRIIDEVEYHDLESCLCPVCATQPFVQVE